MLAARTLDKIFLVILQVALVKVLVVVILTVHCLSLEAALVTLEAVVLVGLFNKPKPKTEKTDFATSFSTGMNLATDLNLGKYSSAFDLGSNTNAFDLGSNTNSFDFTKGIDLGIDWSGSKKSTTTASATNSDFGTSLNLGSFKYKFVHLNKLFERF